MKLFESLKREYTYIRCVTRTMYRMRRVKPDATRIIVDIIEEHAARRPANIAILYQDRAVSYRGLDEGANRYAHWAMAQGVKRGDVVALLMENRPEYLMAWLGLHKLGAVAALVNTNLTGQSLAHSISIAGARHIVVDAELGGNFADAAPLLDPAPVAWAAGGPVRGARDLDAELAISSPMTVDRKARAGLTCKDKAFYIYTSGTTGLPKAANFSHLRMLFMMYGFAGAVNAKQRDRIYCPLPLYHATGGICAVGIAFTAGGTLIIRRKFSAHEFWDDCRTYRATLFQYIGELCRYLLNAPAHSRDGEHSIRAISGNGLRPEIWPTFQKRFAIPRIVEFYGATEGNVSMLNYDGTVGAVGRVPRYMRAVFPTRLVRFDITKEVPVRGEDGFCIECAPGEAGEAVGRISEGPGRGFEGYTRSADTERKILRDAFEKGDAWFRTGDLMRRDEHNYFYFVDRIGDTFRWKGENVATSEVTEALGVVPGIQEVNVYGVSVPGADGRAGMASLVTIPGFDPAKLAGKISLAPFARPVFLRLRPELEITGTFKLKKADLVKDGFDPELIDDPLYWYNPASARYEPLTPPVYADIAAGRMKL
ncbi:MAG: long-chain-acyl-CoA synthetase [Alphaproteobacteria bacterium]|nr:long-chain-acyl-CoA synthetase [Alphaproteobacteria bacterium]MDE2109743.1 long-chain-acyl-CoA synthetase [Alphaproteobacteria bacterium]MDE2494367.1 long-chain-acyl-CoA synthetase [Alphaproteobacteria bacterium]